MKTILFLSILSSITLFSQHIAHESIIATMAKIPPLPTNIATADKEPEQVFQAIEVQIQKITEQMQGINASSKNEVRDAEAAVREINRDGVTNSSGTKAESPEVADARKKAHHVMNEISTWSQKHQNDMMKLTDSLNNMMGAVDAEFATDFAKLPRIIEGQEVSNEYRTKNLALMRTYDEKKKNCCNRMLLACNKLYMQHYADLKNIGKPFDDALKAIDYGDKLSNNPLSNTETELSAAQNSILLMLTMLENNAKDIYIKANVWFRMHRERQQRIERKELITEEELRGF